MTDKYKELSGNDPNDASDIGIRLKVLAGEIYSLKTSCEWLKRQLFVQTAAGESLDRFAYERGLTRNKAVEGTITLTFRRNEATPQAVTIPAGTVCSTNDKAPVLFETTADCRIVSNGTYVSIGARSIAAGKSANVPAGKITVIVSAIAGVDSVTNSASVTNGVDAESDDDLRQRIMKSLSEVSNGTNKTYYESIALSYSGVTSVSVEPRARGNGTVNVYLAKDGGPAEQSVINSVQSYLSTAREVNVDVKVSGAALKVVNVYMFLTARDGYTISQVQANCLASLKKFFESARVGQSFTMADIRNSVYNTAGVEDFDIDTTMTTSPTVTPGQILTMGTISLLT